MSNFSWYAGRLRSMSPAELSWRAGRIARNQLAKGSSSQGDFSTPIGGWRDAFAAFVGGKDRPVLLDRAPAQALATAEPALVQALIEAARTAAEQRFSYFGYPEVRLPRPTNWNYDPVANVQWPRRSSARIDHRTAEGDVKWIWELNRLQHLPLLAEAWLMTGDDSFSAAAFEQLDSWIAQNPPGRGIAWRGAFEVGLRSISICVAIQGLRDSPALTMERYRSILGLLAESARRCWSDRSRFSSANNHLVGELVGLATIAILFPELPSARRWEHRAVAALEAQADRQILPDGAGAEQAVGYQVFTAELLLVVAHLLRLRDGAAPSRLLEAVGRSARYLGAVVGAADPEPGYGDGDEGFALRLGPEQVRTIREHLAVVGSALGDSELAGLGRPSLTGWWLRGQASVVGPKLPKNLYAPDGGLVVLRGGNRRVTMDVGPLGYLSIAAHGHADALALTLASDGVELIGDPGAGSYYGNPDRRRVHRGTRSHATVAVDGLDQSESGGPFLWTHHAQVRVGTVDLEAGIVDAEHDGYCRLSAPVRHRRWLIAPPEEDSVLVVDLLQGSGHHEAVVSWPLAPGVRSRFSPDSSPNTIWADHRDGPGLRLDYAATVKVTADQVIGDQSSHRGWWTERLERPVPAALLGLHGSGTLPMVFATLLTPSSAETLVDGLSVSITGDELIVGWQAGSASHRITLSVGKSGGIHIAGRRLSGERQILATDKW